MKQEIKLNPNKEIVSNIREKLKESNGYCPCKLEKIHDNICPCKEFRQQKVSGFCHCELYYKEVTDA